MLYDGIQIEAEFRPGDKRPWKDDAGKTQYTTMHAVYGEVPGTEGQDGDPVDVYVGDKKSSRVFVVKQMVRGDWKRFDEEKCILGTATPVEATALYMAHYSDPRFFGGIKEMSMTEFKQRLASRGIEGKKLASNPHAQSSTADRVDDVGIGILAAPYAAGAVGKALANRPGRLGAIGKGALKAKDWMHHHENKLELGGLALVAPGITHRVADTIDKGIAKFKGVPQNPAKTAGVAGAPKLLRASNLIKGGIIAGGLTTAYGAKKTIDHVGKIVREDESRPLPSYRGANIF